MLNQKTLNRIARHLAAHNPLADADFGQEVSSNIRQYGTDLAAIEAAAGMVAAENAARARIWAAATDDDTHPYAVPIQDGSHTALDALLAAGLKGVKQKTAPEVECTAELAARAANIDLSYIREEFGKNGEYECVDQGILEAIEAVARAQDVGSRMVALAKLWGICVFATGEVPANWSLYDRNEPYLLEYAKSLALRAEAVPGETGGDIA